MLTKTQMEVLNIINSAILSDGIPPTMKEVSYAAGISPEWARKTAFTLDALGFLKIHRNKARSIKILRLPDEVKTAA
jgi:SOS-response transcriptional repressor LexA